MKKCELIFQITKRIINGEKYPDFVHEYDDQIRELDLNAFNKLQFCSFMAQVHPKVISGILYNNNSDYLEFLYSIWKAAEKVADANYMTVIRKIPKKQFDEIIDGLDEDGLSRIQMRVS